MQVDLDGSWTYNSYLGRHASPEHDDLFQEALPVLIELLENWRVPTTFFAVGRDLEVRWKQEIIRRASESGNEIANHSMNHVLGFRGLDGATKRTEIKRMADLCQEVIGVDPVGFRAPGFDVDGETLELLEEMGYDYDSSVIPTFAYPLVLAADKIWHGLRGERVPSWRHGPGFGWFRCPGAPYFPSRGSYIRRGCPRDILEVPVSTHPILKIPLHPAFTSVLGTRWFEAAWREIQGRDLPLVVLFHLKDFRSLIEDGDDRPCRLANQVLRVVSSEFRPVKTGELARQHREITELSQAESEQASREDPI